MTREEAIDQGIDQIRAALGAAYDAGIAERPAGEEPTQPPVEPGTEGEEIATLRAQLADAKSALEQTQKDLADAQADDIADDEKIAKLEGVVSQIDAIVDALKAAPAPAPVEEVDEEEEESGLETDARGQETPVNGSDLSAPSKI